MIREEEKVLGIFSLSVYLVIEEFHINHITSIGGQHLYYHVTTLLEQPVSLSKNTGYGRHLISGFVQIEARIQCPV